jgi:vanillate/3-O-methylgallate O-demethylase
MLEVREPMFTLKSPLFEGATLFFPFGDGLIVPYEFEGVQVEAAAARTSAWIGTQLMISPVHDVKGPDAMRFLNSVCVNDFTKMTDKGVRHGLICNERGQIMSEGVVIKLADDHYRTYWLNPPLQYLIDTSGMDVVGEDVSFQEYFIQIDGERSLEILERATGEDLHDIGFARHRLVKIGDKDMRVLRLGMAGGLGYEVHGRIEDFDEVYSKIWEAGKAFGAKKLGMHAYAGLNHTPGGLPNILVHYPAPLFESEEGRFSGLSEYLSTRPYEAVFQYNRRLRGSVGSDLEARFVTPYDLGLGGLVNFAKPDDFPGRTALEELSKAPPRKIVTLEWNADDVAAIYATQLSGRDVEPCENITQPTDYSYQDFILGQGQPDKGYNYRADHVMSDGKIVGISTGRVMDYHYRCMLSLAFIDAEHEVIGTELTLLWGTPGTPQREIRVTASKFPFHDAVPNRLRDVATIPRLRT